MGLKRGNTYNTSFEIKELPANTPMDLTGLTAKFVVETKKFTASIDTPATDGKVSIELTPTETASVDRGLRQAWCELTFPDGDVRSYGEHTIEVTD